MKILALGVAIFVSALFSKYEFTVLPDNHFSLMSDVSCELAQTDPEFSNGAFDRLSCALSRDVPFDSVDCFLSSLKFRMKNPSGDKHQKIEANDHEENDHKQTIDEQSDESFRFDISG